MTVATQNTLNSQLTLTRMIVNNSLRLLLVFFITLITAISSAENPIEPLENHTKYDLKITKEEMDWIKQNPIIHVGASSDFQPYLIKTPDGSLRGILPDFYEILSERLGIQFVIHDYRWPVPLQKIQKNELDMIAAIGKNTANTLGLITSDTFSSPLITVFARTDNSLNITKDEDISTLRVAYYKETRLLKKYFNENNIKTIPVDSILDGFKLLLREKVDVVVGFNHESYHLRKNMISEIDPIYTFKHLSLDPVAAIRPDMPILAGILDKGISTLEHEQIKKIVSKWSWTPKTLDKVEKIHLTVQEKEWLEKKHTVRVRVSNFPPFEFIDDNQQGISVDFLKLIAERTGVSFQFISENRLFKEAFRGLLNKTGPDLLLSVMETPSRKNELSFSKPYFSSPRVIYTLSDNNHIHGIEDLDGFTVAVPQESHIHDQLKKQYPLINLQIYQTDPQAIEAVAFGHADAYIGNLTQGSFLISKQGLSNLKVAAPALFSNHVFNYGIRKDWPELSSIIDKGLATITPKERIDIRKKYISIIYEHYENKSILKWLMIATIAATGIIFLFLIWNRQLNQEIKKRKKAEDDLQTTNQRLALAIEVASVGIWDWDLAKEEGSWNDRMFEIYQIPKQNPIPFEAWAQVVHPEDLTRTVEFFEDAIRNGLPDFTEYRIIMPDKTIQHIHAATMPIKDDNDRVTSIFGVNIDISERKQTEKRLEHRVAERTQDLKLEIIERQRATKALAQNEEKYRWMIDSAIVGVFTTNIKGELLFVNDAFAEMYDFDSKEEMKRVGILPRWADLKRREDMLRGLREDGVVNNFESEMVTATGRHIHVMFSSVLQGDTTSGMAIDITDRKEAEIALIESEKEFLAIFEQTAIGLSRVSLDGGFKQVNQKFSDITGYTTEELCSLSIEDITFPEDLEAEMQIIPLLLDGTQSGYNMRKRLIKKDGNLIWVHLTVTLVRDDNSNPLYYLGAIADIDASKKAEDALEQSNERFKKVFDNAPVLIEAFTAEGRWTMWNKECEKIFGWTEEEILSHKNPIELFYPDPKDQQQVFETIMTTPDNVFSEWYPRRKDGEVVTCSWANYKLNDGNIISLGYDITEDKLTEKKIQEYQQRLKSLAAQLTLVEEQERRRIAADLHDNVGQSLALTRLQLATVRKSLPKNSEQDIMFKDISSTLLKTIQDTRHLIFELSSPFLNELGLGAAINEWMKEQISGKHNINFKLIDKSKNLVLDNDLRAILFRNVRELLINAIKHAKAESISIRLEYREQVFSITIQDDGVGFDPQIVSINDKANKCFGLFSVQERMNDLEGGFKISSKPGAGSNFELYLPIKNKKLEAVHE